MDITKINKTHTKSVNKYAKDLISNNKKISEIYNNINHKEPNNSIDKEIKNEKMTKIKENDSSY